MGAALPLLPLEHPALRRVTKGRIMPDTKTEAVVTSTLSAVVTRADGTTEDLGVISTTQVPPWKARLLSRLLKGLRHVSR